MGRGLAAERACQATAVAADQQLRSEAIEVARRAARVGQVQWDSLVRARRLTFAPATALTAHAKHDVT